MTYLMKRFLRFGCGPLGTRGRLWQCKMVDKIMKMSPPALKTHPHIMPSTTPSLSPSEVEGRDFEVGIEIWDDIHIGVHVLTMVTLEKLNSLLDIVVGYITMHEFPDGYK